MPMMLLSLSQAVTISNELSRKLVLPAGLIWKKGGFKYLGVYLGDDNFLCKNWDNVLEKVEGRFKKWK